MTIEWTANLVHKVDKVMIPATFEAEYDIDAVTAKVRDRFGKQHIIVTFYPTDHMLRARFIHDRQQWMARRRVSDDHNQLDGPHHRARRRYDPGDV